jgi:hypothetical protein
VVAVLVVAALVLVARPDGEALLFRPGAPPVAACTRCGRSSPSTSTTSPPIADTAGTAESRRTMFTVLMPRSLARCTT